MIQNPAPVNMPDLSSITVDFRIIDSHHHLFNLDQIYYPWLTDCPDKKFFLGNYDNIKKNYLLEDYLLDAGGLPIIQTVHVEAEADHDKPIDETRWLDTLRKDTGKPSALVAHAWLHKKDTEETLSAQASFEAVRGIRSKPVTSASPSERIGVAQQIGSMSDPKWKKGIGLLRKYNFSWDLRVPYWHLSDAAEICNVYPDLLVVIEHTGLPWDRTEQGLEEWRNGMSKLAKYPNVFLKISELGLGRAPWDYVRNRAIVREAIEMFGFKRSMFGSNFPVAGLRINFVDQVKSIASMVSDCSCDEREQLFFETAKMFYRL